MKAIKLMLYSAFAAHMPRAFAWPGMKRTMSDTRKLSTRQDTQQQQLIGDLLTLTDSQLTSIGKDIKAILLGTNSGESDTIDTSIPASLGSSACSADICCVWKWISYDMQAKFNGTSERCTKYARGAVPLGFHDAGAWSNTSAYGGADGSILTDEINRSENNGLADIASVMNDWYNKYHQYGVIMADLIQMGATVAAVVCPLGPRVRSFVGRIDNPRAAPTGLLPDVNDSADKLISLFQAKTIDAHGLTALVGAHTSSQQHFVDTSRDGDPQDSTPGVWDVKFYGETLGSPPPRVMKFASDVKLSKDSRTSDEWNQFVGKQGHWNADYAQEYIRLSLLGVNNINKLQECTKVLPPAVTSFSAADQVVLDLWLPGQYDQLRSYVDDAVLLTGFVSTTTGP